MFTQMHTGDGSLMAELLMFSAQALFGGNYDLSNVNKVELTNTIAVHRVT